MNDKDIRKILINYLLAERQDIRIYQEKSIGSSICDVMVVSSHLAGYEIKSDSVRASRSLSHRASTQAESRLKSTGRGSVSSMENESPRASQAKTLCVKWACRLIPFTAVSGSMKRNTGMQSRLLLDSPSE